MDPEEFQAWKDSPATQWVLLRLKAIADRVELATKERLYHATLIAAPDWASLQASCGSDRRYVDALREVIELEHEDIDRDRAE